MVSLRSAVLSVIIALVAQALCGEENRPLTPVSYRDVHLSAGFWNTWQETNRKAIIPYVLRRLEQAGHIDNFAKAAGTTGGKSVGEIYYDSDLYKVIEGASYCLASEPSPRLAAEVDRLIAIIAAAQQPDGYLDTPSVLRDPKQRWKSPGRHELYCAGHLLEAAAAHYEATGKKDLLRVACRLADHLAATFGPGPTQVHFPPEHQGVELGLLRLSQATGQRRYADLANYFLDQRGRTKGRGSYGPYAQDHRPVLEQTEAVGHAVRAAYMYAAMAELEGCGRRLDYDAPLQNIFADLCRGKMFVSGGVGLLQQGNSYESFTDAWFLPNDQPDVDTCSVIGLVFWLHRMNLLHPDGRYGDMIERILYNRLLAGVSLDGTRFFYGCPLESRGPGTFNRGPGAECDVRHTRPKWFSCVCCPTNIPRILPVIGGYAYAQRDGCLYIDQYVPGEAKVHLGNAEVNVVVATDYPWDGHIRIELRPPRASEFALYLRIPGWARGEEFPGGLYRAENFNDKPAMKLNGRAMELPEVRGGFARIQRQWQSGDSVELLLPMAIRRIHADSRVASTRGRVALMRGPVLYCVEGIDAGGHARQLVLPRGAAICAEHRADFLGGVTVLRGTATESIEAKAENRSIGFTAIPFYAWDNREPGDMVVWLRESP
jgi:uncharacterized protein